MRDLICIIPVSELVNAKSRLSSFLNYDERRGLLEMMLLDIVSNISNHVESIVLVSKDEKIRDFCKHHKLKFVKEEEHEGNFLNNAISDAISRIKMDYPDDDYLILPSDIPLICEEHIIAVKDKDCDLVISPSKGGGTNLLCFNNSFDFKCCFGKMSFFEHMKEASRLGMNYEVYDSFYLSLDVNTKHDLGEILLHGEGTFTQDYLSGLGIFVKSSHGEERLYVERRD